jgi:hypothetical protein
MARAIESLCFDHQKVYYHVSVNTFWQLIYKFISIGDFQRLNNFIVSSISFSY